MAKIDTTGIEGYDSMTPEQKLAALESYEYEDLSPEVERYKNAVTKANSEAAEWKKKHNALLSDEEQKRQTSEEQLASMQQELETLRQEKVISNYKSQYLAQGYDEALASETAIALAKGEMEKVFVNQKKFIELHDKTFKADILKQTPTPPAGGSGGAMTKEKFLTLNTEEQNKFITDNPNWKSELN